MRRRVQKSKHSAYIDALDTSNEVIRIRTDNENSRVFKGVHTSRVKIPNPSTCIHRSPQHGGCERPIIRAVPCRMTVHVRGRSGPNSSSVHIKSSTRPHELSLEHVGMRNGHPYTRAIHPHLNKSSSIITDKIRTFTIDFRIGRQYQRSRQTLSEDRRTRYELEHVCVYLLPPSLPSFRPY